MATVQVDTITNTAGTGAPNFPFGLTGFLKNSSGTKDMANAAYVITDTDGFGVFISASTLTANRALTLPATASNIGRVISVKKVDAGLFAINITPAGADSIDESTAVLALTNQWASATLYCTVSGKWVLLEVINIGPTVQKFTSGSGTYTLPAYVRSIKVKVSGGGGGGGGSGPTAGSGTAGGNSTFTGSNSTITANGGSLGSGTANVAGGAGGTASITGTAVGTAVTGGRGASGAAISFSTGGSGGVNPLGGAGQPGPSTPAAGGSGAANTGAGASGGSGTTSIQGGNGGGSGGYVDVVITFPEATYTYAVGAAGTAGTAGTGGAAGGTGAAGYLEVIEFYT